ncbi:hypothetical protein DIURU_000802 [Diutina rugosa]|uniref:EamA domain-containing protein n=1 Tax=Diutina rugosa TaxID=5481 RepID=A0A642UWU6_DIURU|nr:uncharacterized protein DIURU_000802 [Diutina rugosa]KAA8907118.1 hypothetical protein DIURU_000802 [Diutina rugosa]
MVHMISTENPSEGVSRTKMAFIGGAFLVSLTSFVVQTEFTSQVYKIGFSEPLVLLWITHGMWWILWPIQAISAASYRTFNKWRSSTAPVVVVGRGAASSSAHYERLPINSSDPLDLEDPHAVVMKQKLRLYSYFKKCIVKQLHNIYHTAVVIYEANVNGDTSTEELNKLIERNPKLSSSSSVLDCARSMITTPAIKYLLKYSFYITVVLTLAGCTWYAAMALTFASDVTAIYNCSAFTAYAFAIPMLHEKFSWLKVSSVFIAITGVFIVSYSGSSDDANTEYPYRLWGNLLILFGAVLYGYYECLYKKYCCIPNHLARYISPRRQSSFANFVMALFGVYTFIILTSCMLISELTGIHRFKFYYGENNTRVWSLVIGSIAGNLLFSGSFLLLMALTSPVLSSVSSLVTIFIIGVVEWVLFDNALSSQQLLGDFLIIIGFLLLTYASWKEITEGSDDANDMDGVSTYSFAVSAASDNE